MRKIRFGFGGTNLPTPWKVQKVVSSIKYILGVVSVSEFIAGEPAISFWLLLGGAFIDEAGKYFYEE